MIKVNGVTLQIEELPKLIFMANDSDVKGRAHKSFSINIIRNVHNDAALGGLFSTKYYRPVLFDAMFDRYAGHIIIGSIDRDKAKAVFISGNGTLWAKLVDQSLRTLTLPTHELSLATVKASEDGGLYVYDLADRGGFDSEKVGAVAVAITQRYPAINVSELIKNIFNSLEVGVVNAGIDDDIYLMFTQDKNIRNDSEWIKRQTTNLGLFNNLNFNSGALGASFEIEELIEFDKEVPDVSVYNGDGNYKTTEAGTYRMKVAYSIALGKANETVLSNEYAKVEIRTGATSGGAEAVVSVANLTVVWAGMSEYAVTGIVDTGFIELPADHYLRVYVIFGATVVDDPVSDQPTMVIVNTTNADCTASRYYGAGSTVNLAALLPDETILSFLGRLFTHLNIDVIFDQVFNQFYLFRISGIAANVFDCWDFEESISERTNALFRYNSDKEQTPETETLILDAGFETSEISLPFSRTLFGSVFRLLASVTPQLPTLWGSLDPSLVKSDGVEYATPPHDSKANLRLIRYIGKKTGASFLQSYGANTAIRPADKWSETATTLPEFAEVLVKSYHAGSYISERAEASAKVRITGSDLERLFSNEYFRQAVRLRDRDSGADLIAGRLIECTQLEGDIYTMKVRAL